MEENLSHKSFLPGLRLNGLARFHACNVSLLLVNAKKHSCHLIARQEESSVNLRGRTNLRFKIQISRTHQTVWSIATPLRVINDDIQYETPNVSGTKK